MKHPARFLMIGLLSVLDLYGLVSQAEAAENLAFDWVAQESELIQIGVDSKGALYGLDPGGRALRWISLPRPRWFNLNADLERLEVRSESREVWGIEKQTGFATRFNRSWWVQKGDLRFKDLTLDERGNAYGLTRDGDLVTWRADREKWESLFDQPQPQVSRLAHAGKDELWVVMQSGSLLRIRSDGGGERIDPGPFADVIIDPHRELAFGLAEDGSVTGFTMTKEVERVAIEAPPLRSLVLVSPDQAWGVGLDSRVYRGERRLPVEVLAEATPPLIDPETDQAEVAREDPKAAPSEQGTDGSAGEAEDTAFRLKLFKLAGEAEQLAIGDDGRVFGLASDNSLAMWSNGSNAFFDFPGHAAAAAVGPKGELWAIDGVGNLAQFDGKVWENRDFSSARRVWVSPDGDVWVSDTDENLFVYDRRRKRFEKQKLTGDDFTFDASGRFWTVRRDGQIYRCEGRRCRKMPLVGRQIVAGRQGGVFMIDRSDRLYRFLEDQGRWDLIRKDTKHITLGPGDQPWLIDTSGDLYASALFERDEKQDRRIAEAARKTLERSTRLSSLSSQSSGSFTFKKNLKWDQISVEGSSKPRIMFVGPNDSAFAIDTTFSVVWEYDAGKEKFELYTDAPKTDGTTIRRMAVDEDGRPWFLYSDNTLYRPDGSKSFKQLTSVNANHIDINYKEKVLVLDTANAFFEYDADKDSLEDADINHSANPGDFAVDPDGNPWTRNGTSERLQEWTGKKFEDRPDDSVQKIDNVGIGGDGSVYISEEVGGSGRLLKWNTSNEDFDDVSLPSGVSVLWVDVGADGRPWFVSTANTIYRAK
ncbi:MAG: hypothetical protein ACPGOV_15055 [Magnetovibrionaceae bacterium]